MKLEKVLDDQEIPYKKLWHRPTYTSQDLAAAEHVSGYEVAKPVVVRGARGFAMCVVAAPDQVDLNKVARLLGEESVRLATEDEMKSLFPDCELGAEPPVGNLFGIRTIMDHRLRYDERLFMQIGSHTEAVRMRRDDWEQITQPIVGAIART
ncbi:MAG: hypothetical protein DCC65_12675 [Planctomycetota bacterium]|nr:MAG: hypothetical protein DCC65_12675 [Planctomycetota bacterium]